MGWEENAEKTVTLAEGLASTGAHLVRMMKVTESSTASVRSDEPVPNFFMVHALLLEVGSSPLSRDGLMLAMPPANRRIQFLGDSMTAGLHNLQNNHTCVPAVHLPVCHTAAARRRRAADTGALTPPPASVSLAGGWCGQNTSDPPREDFSLSFPSLTCAAFGAACHTTASSGMGIAQNWPDPCSGKLTMPDVWRRALATNGTSAENVFPFSGFVPDAVVVNLGTNDELQAFGEYDAYVRRYSRLLLEAARGYGPNTTHYFLACGPLSTCYCDSVKEVIRAVRLEGLNASFVDMRTLGNGSYGEVCGSHPSTAIDNAMGRVLQAAIARHMGWDARHDEGGGG